MLRKSFHVFLLTLFSFLSFSLSSAYAESNLDFEVITMHYGFLNAEPLTDGENEGLISYSVQANAVQGDTQLIYNPGGFDLNPSELFVYKTTSGSYYIGQVQSVAVAGNDIQLQLVNPLKGNISAGSNIWNFYQDQFHPNDSGYKAIVDAALSQLSGENFINKIHAFIGDSWFDNGTMVPYFESKLGASQVINGGVGGRTSAELLDMFDSEFPAGGTQPDYFWVIVGTNDYDQNVPRASFINNLTDIIQKINDRGAKALVFTSSVGQVNSSNNLLSHHYADDLIALKQSSGGNGITAVTQGDNLVIEFTPTSTIASDSHVLFFIDTDNDSATGYQYSGEWVNAGSDRLIQDNQIHKSLGNDWQWEDLGVQATPISRSKIVVAKSDIGLANSPQNTIINIGVIVSSSDYSIIQAFYPSNGQMQQVIINKSTQPAFSVVPDSANTTQGNAVTIDVLANDTGSGLSIDTFDTPAHGTVTNTNNKLVYQPNTGFSGTEIFSYQAIDASGNTASANITITVTASGGGSNPVANNDTATVVAGEMVTIDVLANDTGNGIQLAAVDETWTGNISIVNGKLKYQSDGNYIGEMVVWYGIEDAQENIDWASLTISITESGGGSTEFEINNDTATVTAGGSVIIDVLANDTGSHLDLCCVSGAWTGTLSLVNGKVKYVSDGSFIGDIVLWYDVKDDDDNWGWASITITINP